MSDQNTQFIDPLEDLLGRQAEAISNAPVNPPSQHVETNDDDDEYGAGDLAKEIAAAEAEEERQRAERQALLRAEAEEREKSKTKMPPRSLDPEFQKESIEFQTMNLSIVNRMVQEVLQKHNITTGEIPDSTPEDPDFKMHVMGNLMEYYHLNGETVTPEFEQMVLSSWKGYVDPDLKEDEPETVEEDLPTNTPSNETPQINIQVEKGTPVTVNIDESVKQNLVKNDQINIRVIEVTEEQMRTSKVILNSQNEGIITPYVSETYDVPLTLPLSGYRCTIRPVNYWQFIQLGSPMSGNRIDADKKSWSIIYDHIKNTSIGPFKDFEDFLKKTKYADQQLLLWGVLISVTNEEETITIRCGNPKCRELHDIVYRPREIIHVNDELMAKYQYQKTATIADGQAAIDHYNDINSTIKLYELPHTKFLVEIDTRPSAYDFLNRRYPLMDALRERFINAGVAEDDLEEDPQYNYLLAQAMFITSISKVVDDKTYKFDNWDDIERIITTSLDMNDAAILMQIVQKLAMETASPVKFYLENVKCEKCGRVDKKMDIPDIGQTLIFQLSQRLSSTEINLTEMELN